MRILELNYNKKIFFIIIKMSKELEQWILHNPWIKESDTYKTGEYKKYKPETVPKLKFSDEKKLTSKKVITFINFWNYYNNIDLYIYILNNKEDFKDIKDCNNFINNPTDVAAENGNLNLLTYLYENNYKLDKYVLPYAAKGGNLDIIKWLVDHECKLNELTFKFAAINGNLDNMKWLLKNNCPYNEQTFNNAVHNGNIDNMEWLYENNFPLSSKAFESAIFENNINAMQWLKDHKCPWNRSTFEYALYIKKPLSVMKWLLDNGCPHDNKFSYTVIKSLGDEELIAWAEENLKPKPKR